MDKIAASNTPLGLGKQSLRADTAMLKVYTKQIFLKIRKPNMLARLVPKGFRNILFKNINTLITWNDTYAKAKLHKFLG
ncbi:MAG: hypothetical protein AB8G05_22910 [Oligoflexales bacterium]